MLFYVFLICFVAILTVTGHSALVLWEEAKHIEAALEAMEILDEWIYGSETNKDNNE